MNYNNGLYGDICNLRDVKKIKYVKRSWYSDFSYKISLYKKRKIEQFMKLGFIVKSNKKWCSDSKKWKTDYIVLKVIKISIYTIANFSSTKYIVDRTFKISLNNN